MEKGEIWVLIVEVIVKFEVKFGDYKGFEVEKCEIEFIIEELEVELK